MSGERVGGGGGTNRGAGASDSGSGVGVLVSSSDPEELALLCDRVLVLRHGSVAAELPSGCTAEQINDLTL